MLNYILGNHTNLFFVSNQRFTTNLAVKMTGGFVPSVMTQTSGSLLNARKRTLRLYKDLMRAVRFVIAWTSINLT